MKIPELETERLILRRHEEKDFADMREYLSDEKVVAFEPYLPMSDDEVRECLRERMGSDEFIAVEEKASGKMIGNLYVGERFCDSVEIGYVLERLGFRREGFLQKNVYFRTDNAGNPIWKDSFLYAKRQDTEALPERIQKLETQMHYTITLTVSDPANADLAGTFHITTTWQQNGEGYQVIFNMDQRVS